MMPHYSQTYTPNNRTQCTSDHVEYTGIKSLDPNLELKYNKSYIGLSKDGQPYNSVTFRPKKNFLTFEPKLPKSEELDKLIEEAGLDTLEYNKRWGFYRLRLTAGDIGSKAAVLRRLIKDAYERRTSL